jgi:hypothetical protein
VNTGAFLCRLIYLRREHSRAALMPPGRGIKNVDGELAGARLI